MVPENLPLKATNTSDITVSSYEICLYLKLVGLVCDLQLSLVIEKVNGFCAYGVTGKCAQIPRWFPLRSYSWRRRETPVT